LAELSSSALGDWKVARTRRLESLRYFFGCGFINSVNAAPAINRMPAVMKEDW
jgi:hypothetical protein